MENELITGIVTIAGGLFSIDRTIALVKALRQNEKSHDCPLDHERLKSLLERVVDSQANTIDILRELAEGQKVLLDRKPPSDRPRALEIIQAYDRSRKRPIVTDPPEEK